ncbi:geranylgeranyl reductase [Rhodopseudomonas julia]|uniref:geranylgeranyl diphosphate reductase n=1 Tax=Rhodopseudomonas julia TaxID=200617 RepID=A0ABU0CE82_9BRAD|nr:geranylgeranyl diphosphate reductase [Rhodopseudomonas julia]MDQ0327382.1 geranylgeranyl reductase [Rhodopseudomonas julia]
MPESKTYDVVVVGGGPAGATAATDLASKGHSVLLLDRQGRIKPCGGAVPPRLLRDFNIPTSMLVAQVSSAEIVSPTDRRVNMPIEGGFVGMVDREHFDEWLRQRAAEAGAERCAGTFEAFDRDTDGVARIHYRPKDGGRDASLDVVRARAVIGADGANSAVAREAVPRAGRVPYVFAYHEIVRSPQNGAAHFDPKRCDVYYNGRMSPDFYSWVFPHGDTTSIGTGSANKGFSLRNAVADLRGITGLDAAETIRKEGAPIPLKPRRKWDNDQDVLLAGDAAGVVAPASGEGIYYAMVCGRFAGEAVEEFLRTNDAKALAGARKRFMKEHGRVFWILGIMQYFWYKNDKRRERFVSMCADPDVQRLTWEAYMNKKLVRARPGAHLRVFFKDVAHLLGLVQPDEAGKIGPRRRVS